MARSRLNPIFGGFFVCIHRLAPNGGRARASKIGNEQNIAIREYNIRIFMDRS